MPATSVRAQSIGLAVQVVHCLDVASPSPQTCTFGDMYCQEEGTYAVFNAVVRAVSYG